MEKGNKKIVNAWATYDLANSAYNLVITATIFPIYYESVTPETIRLFSGTLKNTTLYDFALALAYLIIAAIAPLLSGIADYGGSKKRFMQFFTYMGALSCAGMCFFTAETIWLGLMLAILACIGYSGSLVFYNAYLPEIADPEQQDAVSAKGYARGYWGSSVLLIINLLLITFSERIGLDKKTATRIAFLTVGVWWLGFAQIPFYFLPNNVYNKKPQGAYLLKGYRELRNVWRDLKHNKALKRFLTGFFFYSMGVQTVMLIATHFGKKEIHMESSELIATILIIQFLAIVGAYLFSYISRLMGNLFTLKAATFIWALICMSTYWFVYTSAHFYIVAGWVGLVMGGIQSLSRSTYSKMLPETEDHASYFSFYDVTEKLSIVCGMGLFALINEWSETMRSPILILIAFFAAGFLLLQRVPRKQTTDV